MSGNDFENFFPDDDDDDLFGGSDLDNLEDLEPSFPEDTGDAFDDLDEEEGGLSTTFKVAIALMAAVFLGLMGVIAFLVLNSEEGLSPSAQTATAISSTNQAVETSVAASETAISIQETGVALTETSVAGTKVAEEIVRTTQTQSALNTQVAFEETKSALDATATQFQVAAMLTASAVTPTPPTFTVVIRDPLSNNAPAANVPVCIFIDDGDGVFNPAPGTTSSCLPAEASSSSLSAPSPTSPLSGPTQEGENPIFQASTAQAATATAGTGGGVTGGPTAQATLNPIFQTSTAQAGGSQQIAPPVGTPASIPATATQQAPVIPATPTAEGGGAGFNSGFSLYMQPVGRSFSDPDDGREVAQGEGGDEQVNPGQVFYTNDQGQLVITGLPPGQYWVKIADRIVNFEVTTDAQLLTLDTGTGEPIELLVEGSSQPVGGSGGQIIPSPTTEVINPILATQNAAGTQTAIAGGGVVVQDTVTPIATQLEDTGLFSGDSSEVTSTDLLILALAGMVLVGVVMAARRLRATA
ncbi:MAG: hypothetical protein K8I82_02185 [Anaerolineae bacterium]|nr:hypothetical protein [Anaerolineae bacterium]